MKEKEEEIEMLNAKYEELENNSTSLYKNHKKLNEDYEKLNEDYEKLNEEFNSYKISHPTSTKEKLFHKEI